MGNEIIAERMYRHDLAVMPHALPGTAIYADNAGLAQVVAGPPRTVSSTGPAR
jgi:hypothetical protein